MDMKCGQGLLDAVVCSQNFEYKTSNLMDKAMESLCGYISVLPGAFSAYRYEAIRRNKKIDEKKWPLGEYFGSISKDMEEIGPFKGNMYLAEDRILCFEVLARKGFKYEMHYVKDAVAFTDVPTTLVDLIKQRRRWFNGSFFASIHSLSGLCEFLRNTNHSWFRKAILTVCLL